MNKINNYNLVNRFNTILNYQLSTPVLLAFSYFHSYALILLSIAAALFFPFTIYVLIKEKKYAWLASVTIVVLLPIVIALIIGINQTYLYVALAISLLLFYLICFVIKYAVKEWLKDYNWSQYFENQKIEKEEYQRKINSSKNINDILNL